MTETSPASSAATSSADINLTEIKDTLVSIAKQAGELILAKSGTVAFDDKKNAVDLVTEVDKAVEDLVNSILKTKYPDFEFLGEESFLPGTTKLSDSPTFIVDPIDGTTNFIHFFPHACISLGFAVNKQPAVGVIFNPFLGQLYTGIKGGGSYLNGSKLPLESCPSSRPLSLQGSLCAIEWGSDREGSNYENKLEAFRSLSASKAQGGAFVHGFRSLGSAALNLGAVAAGVCDSYWEGGCYAWDVCAGWIILEEAGGTMASGNKGNFDPSLTERVYLAVRPAQKQEQTTYIQEYWSHLKGDLDYQH